MSERHSEQSTSRFQRDGRSLVVNSRRILAVYVIIGIVFVPTAAIIFTFGKSIAAVFSSEDVLSSTTRLRVVALVFGTASFLVGFAGVTLSYLRFGSINVFSSSPTPSDSERLVNEDDEAAKQLEEYTQSRAAQPPVSLAIQLADELQVRLNEALAAQDRKANLNLLFGCISAALAFIVLALSVFVPPVNLNENAFWAVTIARGLMSATIGSFSFFFLSTYRKNLGELRYFHNEMTNVESKMLAFRFYQTAHFSEASSSDQALREILTSLVTTERNYILKKNETTSEIALRKLDLRDQVALLNIMQAPHDRLDLVPSSGTRRAKGNGTKPKEDF